MGQGRNWWVVLFFTCLVCVHYVFVSGVSNTNIDCILHFSALKSVLLNIASPYLYHRHHSEHNQAGVSAPWSLQLFSWEEAAPSSGDPSPTAIQQWDPSIPFLCLQSEVSQFSHSVMSDSLRPHELQHVRPPCPSPAPRVYPNSCPLSRWCHPTISSSVVPFSSCLQSFPATGSFQMSQLLASGGQRIGVSPSKSILPMNIQDWSPLGWTDWISLQSKGLSRVFSNTTVQKHQFFCAQLSL